MKLTSDYFSDKPIGKGEAAVIAHAKKHNGIVASNNTKDVMPFVEKYNLERITTGDILVMAFENKLITGTSLCILTLDLKAKLRRFKMEHKESWCVTNTVKIR